LTTNGPLQKGFSLRRSHPPAASQTSQFMAP
jgi:hypothetical protein